MKKTILFIIIATILMITPKAAFGEEISSRASATIHTVNAVKDDSETTHVKILQKYLEKRDSPLAPFAGDFVAQAKRYNLDWRFVAAISGLESSFGQQIPYNSYNGWGWGIYGDNMIRFNSWDEGIKTISQGLREKYMNQWGAQDVYEIGSIYASSPTWAQRVTYFMNNIQEFALSDSKTALSLSL